MAAPVDAEVTLATPGGLVRKVTRERQATLLDHDNKLSLTTLTETVTVNGRTATALYNAATRVETVTTPAGRVTINSMDPMGRPILRQVSGLVEVRYGYDARGRLTEVTQGTGVEARRSGVSYGVDGYVSGMTDPLGRKTLFERDPVGRVLRQLQPDGSEIRSFYDGNGNRTVLFPPGRSAHVFEYDALDQEETYMPIDPHSAWYCWHASKRQAMLESIWEKYGAFVHQQLIWSKTRAVMTRTHYLWRHEPCFFGWIKGNKPPRVSEEYLSTVWHMAGLEGDDRPERPSPWTASPFP